MDPSSSTRVNQQSARKQRRAVPKQLSIAEPPQSQRRRSSKKQKIEAESQSESEAEFYTIKDILEEKERKGRISYLVDWEDNPQTGEVYDPTWVPAQDVTKAAIRAWEEKKQNRRKKSTKNQEGNRGTFQQALLENSQVDSSPDSQPIRPAKRRRGSGSLQGSLFKKPRRGGSFEITRLNIVGESLSPQKEIKDSYEEDHSEAETEQKIRVLVPQIGKSFDRSEYAAVRSSQLTGSIAESDANQLTQTPHSSLSLQHPLSPPYVVEQSIRTPRRRTNFIWDEDISPIIPDSQELQGSSFNNPTTQISQSSAASLPTPVEGGSFQDDQAPEQAPSSTFVAAARSVVTRSSSQPEDSLRAHRGINLERRADSEGASSTLVKLALSQLSSPNPVRTSEQIGHSSSHIDEARRSHPEVSSHSLSSKIQQNQQESPSSTLRSTEEERLTLETEEPGVKGSHTNRHRDELKVSHLEVSSLPVISGNTYIARRNSTEETSTQISPFESHAQSEEPKVSLSKDPLPLLIEDGQKQQESSASIVNPTEEERAQSLQPDPGAAELRFQTQLPLPRSSEEFIEPITAVQNNHPQTSHLELGLGETPPPRQINSLQPSVDTEDKIATFPIIKSVHQEQTLNCAHNPQPNRQLQSISTSLPGAELYESQPQTSQQSTSTTESFWQAAQIDSLALRDFAGSSPAQECATRSPGPEADVPESGHLEKTESSQPPLDHNTNVLNAPISSPNQGSLRQIAKNISILILPAEKVIPSIEQSDELTSSASLARPSPPSSGFSQFLDSYRSKLPRRPVSSSDISNMVDQTMSEVPKVPSSSIADMFKAARAAAGHKAIVQQDEERRAASSISSTPAPSTPVTVLAPLQSPALTGLLPTVRQDAETGPPVAPAPVRSSPRLSPGPTLAVEQDTAAVTTSIAPTLALETSILEVEPSSAFGEMLVDQETALIAQITSPEASRGILPVSVSEPATVAQVTDSKITSDILPDPTGEPPAMAQVAPPVASSEVSSELSPEAESTFGLQIQPLEPKQFFIVPLSMNAHVISLYRDELRNVKRERLAFLNDGDDTPNIIDAMSNLIDRLKNLCDHQDLIEDELSTQESRSDVIMTAKWAENISTKCIFMVDFLNRLRALDDRSALRIVLMVRPGRMLGILEACFQHHKFDYNRIGQPEIDSQNGLKIILVPTDVDYASSEIGPAHAVIAFDSSFEHTRHIKNLRGGCENPSAVAPIIQLVVANTAEHLELCIKPTLQRLDRLTALVGGVSKVDKEHLGHLPKDEEYKLPNEAAIAVADFIYHLYDVGNPIDIKTTWPLLSMPTIKNMEGILFSSRATPEESLEPVVHSGSTTQSQNPSSHSSGLHPGVKRPFDSDAADSSKRQRLTTTGGEHNGQLHNTHISETALNTSDGISSSKSAELDSAKTGNSDYDSDFVRSLLLKVSGLEKDLQTRLQSESALRDSNQRLHIQVKDLENSIQEIQPKYQNALNDRGFFESENLKAAKKEATIERKLSLREEKITTLQAENKTLKEEVESLRAALKTSAVPEVALLGRLREEADYLSTEKNKLQKRVKTMENDADYMRGNYQNASTAAADAMAEIDTLKTTMETLRRKASANAVLIHEIQNSNAIKEHMSRIDVLEADKSQLLRELEKRNDELKTLTVGRRPIRGASIPKSPRLNNQSPSAGAKGFRNGSRGNSPVVGEPVRAIFRGDALGYGEKPRWGNHLAD